MRTERQAPVLRFLCRAAHVLDTAGDGELLERFVTRRDEAAFEALMRRHGPMVLGVCRRVLGNEADAEDAFQATFLVLVKKAAAVAQRALVGNWLYGVACNTARKVKAMNGQRRARERRAGAIPLPDPLGEREQHLHALLDEELSRLPDRYRSPIVLCDLEGKPYREAAQLLGCPLGTLSGRLTRARALLARRLARRGLAVSGAALAVALAPAPASAAVPQALLASSLRAASALAAGSSLLSAAASPKVATLTEGVLRMMLLNKLRTVVGGLLALCLVCAGGILALHPAAGQPPAPAKESPGRPEASRPAEPASRLESLWTDLASPDEGKGLRAALALAASKEAVPLFKERLRPVKSDPKRVAQLIAQLDSDDFARRQEAAAELDYLGKFIKADLDKALADNPSLEVKNRIQRLLDQIAGETTVDRSEGPKPAPAAGATMPVPPRPLQVPALPAPAPAGTPVPPPALPPGATPLPAPALPPVAPGAIAPAPAVGPVPVGPTAGSTPVRVTGGRPLAAPRLAWVRAARAVAVLEQIGTPEAKKILEALAEGEAEAPPTKAAKEALERLKN
jgi:RNA polymerase sigma factor (sigma-70 family)